MGWTKSGAGEDGFTLRVYPRRGYDGANRLSIRWIMAMRSQASPVTVSASSSLLKRRLRPRQAKVRSTTPRRGRTTKPWASAGRLTSSRV